MSTGKLYAIKMETIESKKFLIVSGDDGVLVFNWDTDIAEKIQSQQRQLSSSTLKKSEAMSSPTMRFKPHPSPLESRGIEVNDFQVLQGANSNNNYLFGAAGDSFGAYKWDMTTGQLIKNYTSPGGGYLHAVQILPGDSSTLLAGGEGGKLTMWDISQDKLIDHIDMTTVSAIDSSASPSASSTSNLSRSNSKRSKNLPSRWITSICAQSPHWFTVAGGSTGGSGGSGIRASSSSSSSTSGFLATYHAPTRSLVSFTETRETPQQLTMSPASTELSNSSPHNIVSVGNEGVVSHFNALTLERTRRLWCTPPSAYSVESAGRYTAVAGVGCLVDIFDENGEKFLRLTIC